MVRDEVLRTLEQNRGENVSGEALANTLGVSRAAIWKAIDKLRADGFAIDASPGEGYRLNANDDMLTAEAIRAGLQTDALGQTLCVRDVVDSTNTRMKREYASAPHGFALLAETQTAGRGRRGRAFASPPGGGLYMSVLLRPHIPLAQLNFLTLAGAVAVCRAVKETAGFSPSIKWVNDVLMDGKKLCGILTEASVEGETGAVDFAVLGIGVNLRLNRAALPKELQGIIGCLADFSEQIPRRATLAASILRHVEALYSHIEAGNTDELLCAYRSHLCMLGQKICVVCAAESYEAIAETIDGQGHLIVRMEDGALRTLTTGEISIRL